MIRIVYEFYPIVGGSVTHIMEISKNINEYVDQRIIAPYFGEECKCTEFDKKFEIPIIRIKHRPIKRILHIPVTPINHLVYLLKVLFCLRKTRKFDLIQAHYIEAVAVSVIFKKISGVPVIAMMHGADDASKLSGFRESILAKIFKPNHAFILDDGSNAPEKFKKLWKDRVTIVNHGIDTDVFNPMKKNKELINKLGLRESDFVFLSTSSLIPVKNIDLTIKSFKILSNKIEISNIYLLIAGEGSLKIQLINEAKSSGIINNLKFLGGIPNDIIPDYLSIADVVIATSLYSNLNRSIQEAMACEKSVVVFDSGGTKKLIRHMENGLLVKSGDINDFSEKLKLLYENPELREKLGKNARETILRERNWGIRIKKELEVYEKVLYRKNGK